MQQHRHRDIDSLLRQRLGQARGSLYLNSYYVEIRSVGWVERRQKSWEQGYQHAGILLVGPGGYARGGGAVAVAVAGARSLRTAYEFRTGTLHVRVGEKKAPSTTRLTLAKALALATDYNMCRDLQISCYFRKKLSILPLLLLLSPFFFL